MRNRGTVKSVMVAAVIAAVAMVFTVTSTEVEGQNYQAERTAFGAPNFNGIWPVSYTHLPLPTICSV